MVANGWRVRTVPNKPDLTLEPAEKVSKKQESIKLQTKKGIGFTRVLAFVFYLQEPEIVISCIEALSFKKSK